MKNIKIRSVKDKTNKKTWFSAIDLVRLVNGNPNMYQSRKELQDGSMSCRQLVNSNPHISNPHKRAKNYWGYIKNKLALNTSQLAMLCPDGKYRYTDVVDIEQIMFILRACNKRFYMFFFQLHIQKVYKYLKELGKEYADNFVLVCTDRPHLLRRKITIIKDIDIHETQKSSKEDFFSYHCRKVK